MDVIKKDHSITRTLGKESTISLRRKRAFYWTMVTQSSFRFLIQRGSKCVMDLNHPINSELIAISSERAGNLLFDRLISLFGLVVGLSSIIFHEKISK